MVLVLTLIFIAFFVQFPLSTVLFSFLILLVIHCLNPRSIPDFLDGKAKSVPEAKPEEKEYYHVRTTKDIQEDNVKRYMKPDFEMDKEWQRLTAYINKVRDKNQEENLRNLRNDPEWSDDPFVTRSNRPKTNIRKTMR